MSAPPPHRAVFRLPWEAIVFPFLLFAAATPLATWRPWLLWVYLAPVAALVWILITRTVVTPQGLTTHTWLGTRKLAWTEVDRFEFRPSRWAVVVTTAGERHRLPMVRPRDLSAVTAVAGGDLYLARRTPSADPATEPADTPTDHE